MWKCGYWKASVIVLCVLADIADTAERAVAVDFNFTKTNCGQFGCQWFNPSYWSPSGGPPGTGDKATIAVDEGVGLAGSPGVLNGLTLENGATLFTAGSTLNVAGTGGTLAITTVLGSGSLGNNNTRLFVQSGASSGIDFEADFMSVRSGGEITMRGGKAVSRNLIKVSLSSLISGRGTIEINRDAGSAGLELEGILRPETGDFLIRSLSGTIDLDGNISSEPGRLDVTKDGI